MTKMMMTLEIKYLPHFKMHAVSEGSKLSANIVRLAAPLLQKQDGSRQGATGVNSMMRKRTRLTI